MPTFSSAQVTDPFLSTGELLAPMAAFDTHQNQLYKQQSDQQQIGLTDMATVARAAAPLLGMSETDAAAAYPGIVADLQRQGFAKQAPSTYPGHAVTQSLVQRGMTVPEQIQGGFVTAPGVTDALKAAVAPLPGVGGGGGGGTYAPGTPFTPKMLPPGVSLNEDAMVRTIAGEAGSEPLAGQIAVAHVINNRAKGAGVTPRDVVFSPNQFEPWNGGEARARLEAMQPTDPAYQAILNNVVRPVLAGRAADPTGGATHFYAPVAQQALGRPPPSWGQDTPSAVIGGHNFYKLGYGPGQAQTATAPTVAPTVVRAPLNPNAGPRVGAVPPATPTASAPQPGFAPVVPVPGAPTITGQADDASAPVAPDRLALRLGGTNTAGPGAGPDTTLPPIPAPHQLYQTGLPGVTISGPPSNTLAPPSVAAQAAPPQPVAQPPTAPAQAQPRTGVNSPQFQAAMELNRRAQALDMVVDPTGRTKALAASLRAQAALYMQADSVSYDPATGIGTRAITGERVNAPIPAEHWVQNPDGTRTNTSTGKTEYPPTGRQFTDAEGNNWIVLPGGGVKQVTSNPSGVTGSGDDASALRLMNEIGPKIAAANAGTGPPVTPQEQANYESAVEIYRQPAIVKDENTGSNVRIYKRDLPGYLPPVASGSMTNGSGPQQLTPGMTPAQRAAETKLGEDFATTDKKSYDAANTSLGMLTSANNAAEIMNRTPGGWTATGPGANTRMELGSHLNQISGLFGGKPFVDPATIGEWEALNKQTRLMGMQVVNNYFGGSREAASIINGATTAVPNSENSYLGFRMVSSGIEQDLQRQRELYQFKAQQLAAGKPLATAEVEFNKQNPVQNYTQRAIANAVPDDIVAHLTANPDTVAAFDKHFGKGIGEFILKGGRTGMGSSAGAQAGG